MKQESLWQDGLVVASFNKQLRPISGLSLNGSRARARVLMLASLALVLVVFLRLVYLQVWEGERQALFAINNRTELVRKKAPRGLIVDRKDRPLVSNVWLPKASEKEEGVVSREYGYREALAHVVGYISQVREDELGCYRGLCYERGMLVGREGIEKVFEASLRGRDGGVVIELDAHGKQVRIISESEPVAGEKISLSVDAELQKISYEALAGRSGAVVILDMQGKVLASVSSPSFDPNWFTTQPDPPKLNEALKNEDKQYFLNRAVSGQYAPGSVFKPVVAYGGIMEKAIGVSETIEDTGEIKVDRYRYGNWYFDKYGKTEGMIDVAQALARSNDVFFYRLGERMGVESIVNWARKFGIGELTGIELPGESAGYLPTPLLKERRVGEKWFLGNTYHFAIGQGDLTASPLQIARMTLGLVSGRKCRVSILKDSKVDCQEIGLSKEAEEEVVEGMRRTCATGGTAYPFFDFEPTVLCKTGTAQHAGQKTESDLPHSWIIVAYPADNPELVMVVFLDAAGEGSSEAGPVARKILEGWKVIR